MLVFFGGELCRKRRGGILHGCTEVEEKGGSRGATPLFIGGNHCRNNLLRHFWPFPGHLRSENPPEMGKKHPVTRKFMIRATHNMIKCKKVVKKWHFDGFGHVG